ncbi:MAG TPA: 50S ribosomal protein L15 [Candidatus Moranbacteria bacterium]|nr:50S ribosomal protein L15 [Candidatus Moranbacteria bacterium]
MQIHTLKLNNRRKKKKTIGRGGKKGTSSGKGNKGQKARSGAHVDPLFEGGRSTLIDHMKKKKGFKALDGKNAVVSLEKLERKFKDGEVVNKETLIKSKIVDRIDADKGIKILGDGTVLSKKLTIAKGIKLSASAKEAIEKSGGKIEVETEKKKGSK